jgi:hypothetical protein
METQRLTLSNSQKTLKEQILRRIEAIRKGREERTSLAARNAQSQMELEESLVDFRRHEASLTGQKEKVEVY